MASQLGYSEINIKEDKIKEDNNSNKRKRHNKTIKKKNKKVENFLNSMNNLEPMENGEDSLATFNPPPNPTISQKKQSTDYMNDNTESDSEDAISKDYYSSLNAQDVNQSYYNQYIPYYEKTAEVTPLHSSKDELLTKLNYMIQLLEENKDEKTENITEELVLYMFLGIFVIFVVDSFARAGKYTR